MNAIICASLALFTCVIVITIGFRMLDTEMRAAFMLKVFIVILPGLIMLHFVLPADLGFLPEGTTTIKGWDWIDLVFSIFLYFSGFFGGILQLYNIADRGFSLRILIDINTSQNGAMTLDEVMTGYSAGKGIEWMYNKRIIGMKKSGLVIQNGTKLVLTEKGMWVAKLFNSLRRVACVAPQCVE